MKQPEYLARLRDACLMLLAAGLIGWLPIFLQLGRFSGWLIGIPMAVASLVAISGIAALTELPILGKIVRVVLSYAAMLALAVVLIGPMVWMLLISLHQPKSPIPPLDKTWPQVVQVEVKDPAGNTVMVRDAKGEMVPKTESRQFFWENYDTVLNSPTLPVRTFFFNTVVVTFTVVVLQLLITSLCAYGLSRMQFRGRETLFYLFLGSMMFAGPVTQIPVFLMLKSFGWLDTYWALIVPGISSAFSVFLLRQFFLQIPVELDEAARLDGASDWTIYSRVVLPLSKAALATAGAFTFFGVWTDFFGPLIYTDSTNMRTLEVGLSVFKNSYGGSNWPLQMTAALIVMTPLLFVFLFVQRYFTKGIMLGSIK
ncbi:MAG TPA: carbohydrate ABC transporter permease [Fimbriimonadaceae bacterium]|nr:carbohydrate ABC transporter permease [Fimbriimonadaceae bacterium]